MLTEQQVAEIEAALTREHNWRHYLDAALDINLEHVAALCADWRSLRAERDEAIKRATAAEAFADQVRTAMVDTEAATKRVENVLASPQMLERLATHIHDEQWCGWMRHMADKTSQKHHITGEWYPERWWRQARTRYADLSDGEKDSDREEARQIIALIAAALRAAPAEPPCGDCVGCETAAECGR
jgi:hypothetical protein